MCCVASHSHKPWSIEKEGMYAFEWFERFMWGRLGQLAPFSTFKNDLDQNLLTIKAPV